MKKVALLALAIIFITACNSNSSEQSNTESTSTEKGVIEVAVFDVGGMHCESCVKTITNTLSALDGISDARVSLEEEQAKVKFEPAKVSVEEMKTAIEGKGYTVGEVEIIKLDNPAENQGE